jgi:hypothetical protein
MECVDCGKWFNPFSAVHTKIMKPNGKHYFWVIATPHFLERLEERLPEIEDDAYLKAAERIEKVATMKKTQGTKWNGLHIYWRYFFNPKRKRLELEFISLTPPKYFTTKYHKNVEFITVDFE